MQNVVNASGLGWQQRGRPIGQAGGDTLFIPNVVPRESLPHLARQQATDEIQELARAICALSAAQSAYVLEYDQPDGQFTVVFAEPDRCQIEHLILDSISRDLLMNATTLEPHWCQRSAFSGGAALISKLGDRQGRSLWLVLEFTGGDSEAQSRAPSLVPGLATIVQSHLELRRRLDRSRSREMAALTALDRDDCGTIALRADHSVLFSNAAADAILAEETVLQVRRGLLRPTGYHDAMRFQTALDCVVNTPGSGGRPRGAIMMLSHPTYPRPLIAVLVPAAEAGDDRSVAKDVATIVYLVRPDRIGSRGIETICQLYGLSPVETRLAGLLLSGSTVADAATKMRIKADTARAYLKQIFAKTGTHRQSELLHLIGHSLRAVPGAFDFEAA